MVDASTTRLLELERLWRVQKGQHRRISVHKLKKKKLQIQIRGPKNRNKDKKSASFTYPNKNSRYKERKLSLQPLVHLFVFHTCLIPDCERHGIALRQDFFLVWFFCGNQLRFSNLQRTEVVSENLSQATLYSSNGDQERQKRGSNMEAMASQYRVLDSWRNAPPFHFRLGRKWQPWTFLSCSATLTR